MITAALTGAERRTVAALAAIYATRMLGLFLLLPVLALYAAELPDATPGLIGIALGAYGLTQAILQIPFGVWSDRYPRKAVITVGLGIFAIGSVVGIYAHTIFELILARSLQGAGAVSAAVTALMADHTRAEVRTRAMAFIGIAIGGSFIVSLVAAPLLQASIGIAGIFGLVAGLCLLSLILLHTVVPPDVPLSASQSLNLRKLRWALKQPRARSLYVGVFVLHFALTALFLVIPLTLVDALHWPEEQHWKLYLGVFVASLFGTVPLIMRSERGRTQFLPSVILLGAVSQVILAMGREHQALLVVGLTLFFAAFNFLEARLPALLTLAVGSEERGTALGVFATCQFLGAFAGGAVGGQMLQHGGGGAVFAATAGACLVWAVLAHRSREKLHATAANEC
jgi:MFS family permease